MALQSEEISLERNGLPAYVYPPVHEASANGMELSGTESMGVQHIEFNVIGDSVSNRSPSLMVTAAISVDRRAIMIVVASFLLTFTGCGLNFAFGVYQELYETSAGPFQGNVSPAKIDLIGTLAVSLMTIGAPFASAWSRMYSPRTVTLLGGILFGTANILASFGTKLWHLILTQGFLLGCGTCMSYIPAVTVAPGWFDQRRGLAMGIILSGTGVGGVVWAPLLRYLNAAIGFRNTMRATGILAFILISLSSLILKWEHTADLRRQQENETRAARHRRFDIPLVNWNIVRSRTFAAQASGAILQAAAYYTPIYFFSTYARTLGYSDIAGANVIALSNASSACGKVFLGFLADRYGRLNALVLCTVVSAMSTIGLWLPSSVLQDQRLNRSLLLAFSSIYGITAGAYVSLFPTALAEQFGIQNFASINGLLYMLRGIGTLIGTPIAGSLIHRHPGLSSNLASSFERTCLMVGCLLVGASIAVSWARIEAGARAHWPWKM